jgi:uncharacterized protein
MARPRFWNDRPLPELMVGLIAIAIAILVAGVVVAHAVRDVKKRRDTITVTGSARQPITANQVSWKLNVNVRRRSAAEASRRLRRDVQAVREFLRTNGIADEDVTLPPITVQQLQRRTSRKRTVTENALTQTFKITTGDVGQLEAAAGNVSLLLEQGLSLTVGRLSYVSTELSEARLKALQAATKNASERAKAIVEGVGGHLGGVRSASLGVYQIVPRNSNEVSDYGINDTSTRDKDVIAVVSVTFSVD